MKNILINFFLFDKGFGVVSKIFFINKARGFKEYIKKITDQETCSEGIDPRHFLKFDFLSKYIHNFEPMLI